MVVSSKVEKKATGSIIGRHFDEEELAKLEGSYLSLARDLIGEKKLVATGRKVITEEDMAVFLMLLNFFSKNMNADGSLPVARWREMWMALQGAGDIDRAWCHHRFAKTRNFLTRKDLLDWEEEDFVAGVVDDDGVFIPGQAAKWKAGEELMSMMEEVKEPNAGSDAGVLTQHRKEAGESTLYGYSNPTQAHMEEKEGGESTLYSYSTIDRCHSQKKEEGESTLYGCNMSVPCYEGIKEEGESTLYGYSTTQPRISTPSLRQSKSFLEQMDRLGIVIPLQKPRFVGYTTGRYRMAA